MFKKKKLEILSILFKKYIKQVTFTEDDIIFGLPIFSTTYEKILKQIKNLPYMLYCIQHRCLIKRTVFYNQTVEFKKTVSFLLNLELNRIFTNYIIKMMKK